VAKTTNPPTLDRLGTYWTAQGGVNLGVVGNKKHTIGYHLGKDRIFDAGGPGLGHEDYSVQLERDVTDLTNMASAIDLGKLNGRLANLRSFSRWLVARCLADPALRHDIREIIYSPDGTIVQRYSGIDNRIHRGKGNGDLSHRTHTHISFLRDSEKVDKVGLFKPFFEPVWGDVSNEIKAVDPKATRVAAAIRRTGHDFGSAIDLDDLKVALKRAGHDFGVHVDPADVQALLGKSGKA
jgi:hypothetical protein